MAYTLPESLRPLSEWLKKQGADVNSFATERQAAFMAQQLAGSRFKFPERGQPMFPVLLKIQEAISAAPVREADVPRQAKPDKAKPKPGKAKRDEHRGIDHAAFESGLHVFTDGACEPNPGPGGWGVAVYRDKAEISSDHGGDADTTNNRMELTALLKGIEAAKALGAPVVVWSDSKYCVDGCNDWRHGWKKMGWKKAGPKASAKNQEVKNVELWQSIDAALSGADQITIRWCKGHAGIIGNERADELSNIGIASVLGVSMAQDPVDYLTAEYVV